MGCTSLRRSKIDSRSSVMTRVSSPRSALQVGLEVGQVPGPRSQVVDDVAERGELLGDAVVDLAGQPAALLGGGQGAHLAEQQRRLEPQRLLLEQGRRPTSARPGRTALAALDGHQAEGAQADLQRHGRRAAGEPGG